MSNNQTNHGPTDELIDKEDVILRAADALGTLTGWAAVINSDERVREKVDLINAGLTLGLAELRKNATQPPQDERCPVCGEDEPFTGTCGAGDNMRALCKRPAEPEQPVALSTLTDEQIVAIATKAIADGELIWAGFNKDEDGRYTIPELSPSDFKLVRAVLAAASAPAQQATLRKWAALQESNGTPWQEGYDAARRYVAMQLSTPPQPVALSTIREWFPRRLKAAGGQITDLSAFVEEVVRWTEGQHAASAPAQQAGQGELDEDAWLDLAERHVNKDWDSVKPDGFLNAVKALCRDFAASALSRPDCEAMERETLGDFDKQTGIYATTPQPVAAEVEKDTQRLDWLERQGYAYGFEDMHEGNRWLIEGPFRTLRDAIDSDMAGTSSDESKKGEA